MDETSIEDKIIVARARLWTEDLNQLIRKWKNQLGNRQKGHILASRKYKSRHYIFGIPATMLSAFVSTGVLATFRKCDNCDDLNSARCEADQWIRLAIGLISLISIGLTAFMTFINYQEKAEEHKKASGDYESLYRHLESLLEIPGVYRGDPLTILQSIRDRYDSLVKSSPSLSQQYSVDLSYTSTKRKITPPDPKDIESQINPFENKQKRISRKDNPRKNSTFLQKVGDQLPLFSPKKYNNEVSIGVDLDNIEGGNSYENLNRLRELEIEQSRQKAMKFELQKLEANVKQQCERGEQTLRKQQSEAKELPQKKRKMKKDKKNKKKNKDDPDCDSRNDSTGIDIIGNSGSRKSNSIQNNVEKKKAEKKNNEKKKTVKSGLVIPNIPCSKESDEVGISE